MILKKLIFLTIYILFWGYFSVSQADDGQNNCQPLIKFITFQSLDLEQQPPSSLSIKGKLILPVNSEEEDDDGCPQPNKNLPAVVILHGTEGVGFQGGFYAEALNAAGIATLEIDMWEARGVLTPLDRPPLPLFNYPDAFEALKFLSKHDSIDSDRIGVMGFSWGAVITLASATEQYSAEFGGENGPRFSAHVAHYPICYAYNSGIPGGEFKDLTGAPILIQIGTEDDYDQLENETGLGATKCFALKNSLPIEEQKAVQVIAYENAFHEWDRLLVPTVVKDPFSHLGLGEDVSLIPNPAVANKSRKQVLKFFRQHL